MGTMAAAKDASPGPPQEDRGARGAAPRAEDENRDTSPSPDQDEQRASGGLRSGGEEDGSGSESSESSEAEDEEPEEPWDPEGSLAQLRASWHFASALAFIRMMPILKIKPFAADKLEQALLMPEDHQVFLTELLVKLLRPDPSQPYTERDGEGMEQLMARKFHSVWRGHFERNPLKTRAFKDLAPMRRVRPAAGSWPLAAAAGCGARAARPPGRPAAARSAPGCAGSGSCRPGRRRGAVLGLPTAAIPRHGCAARLLTQLLRCR